MHVLLACTQVFAVQVPNHIAYWRVEAFSMLYKECRVFNLPGRGKERERLP